MKRGSMIQKDCRAEIWNMADNTTNRLIYSSSIALAVPLGTSDAHLPNIILALEIVFPQHNDWVSHLWTRHSYKYHAPWTSAWVVKSFWYPTSPNTHKYRSRFLALKYGILILLNHDLILLLIQWFFKHLLMCPSPLQHVLFHQKLVALLHHPVSRKQDQNATRSYLTELRNCFSNITPHSLTIPVLIA